MRNACAGDPPEGELDEVLAAWPKLPPAIRAGILAMVRSQKGGT